MRAIREAVRDDLTGIMQTSASLGYADRDISEIERDLDALVSSERDRLWVYEVDGAIVGWLHVFLSIRVASAPFVEIGGMAVISEYQRQGIGAALESHGANWAAAQGYRIRVRCSAAREDTHAFYRNQGFSTVKTQLVFEKTLVTNQGS